MKTLETVAIVGVGLLGGSIGLALKERRLAQRIVGVGRRESRLREAQNCGAIDEFTTDLKLGVTGAGLVVVCTPVEQIVDHVLEVAAACPADALITDVGSTKEQVVSALDQRLNRHRRTGPRFVGSHPLAGSEKTGVVHARADLFVGRTVVVTPTRSTRREDLEAVQEIWQGLGASIMQLSPRQHDEALATTSHLPHLVATVLAASTPERLLELVASGWGDTTRIAAGDPELWRQILEDNRAHVLKALDKFEKVLDSFREALEREDGRKVRRLLEQGKRKRDAVGS